MQFIIACFFTVTPNELKHVMKFRCNTLDPCLASNKTEGSKMNNYFLLATYIIIMLQRNTSDYIPLFACSLFSLLPHIVSIIFLLRVKSTIWFAEHESRIKMSSPTYLYKRTSTFNSVCHIGNHIGSHVTLVITRYAPNKRIIWKAGRILRDLFSLLGRDGVVVRFQLTRSL